MTHWNNSDKNNIWIFRGNFQLNLVFLDQSALFFFLRRKSQRQGQARAEQQKLVHLGRPQEVAAQSTGSKYFDLFHLNLTEERFVQSPFR